MAAKQRRRRKVGSKGKPRGRAAAATQPAKPRSDRGAPSSPAKSAASYKSPSSRKGRIESARRKRERNRRVAFGVVAGVTVVVAAMVIVALAKPAKQVHDSGSAASAAQLAQNVPESVLNEVGAGKGVTPPQALPAGTSPLTEKGKPQILYMGAEYCPFCAAERWPVVVALGRFGRFTNLAGAVSSASDIYPNTETFTFHGATYASDTLAFSAVETQSAQGTTLEQPTAAQQALFSRYDRPPYVSQSDAGSIPFLLIGNKFVSIGASYSPSVLAGKTRDEIAGALSDPTSPVAQSVDGAANTLTAAICRATAGSPSSVCSSAGVKAAAATLPGG
jgi:Domain of unknown function (DUF929)